MDKFEEALSGLSQKAWSSVKKDLESHIKNKFDILPKKEDPFLPVDTDTKKNLFAQELIEVIKNKKKRAC